MILSVKLLYELTLTISRKWIILFDITLLLVLSPALYYAYLNNSEYKNLITQLEAANTEIVLTNEVKVPSFYNKYILKPYTSEFDEFYLSFSPAYYENRYIANAYHLNSVSFLPESFVNDIKNVPRTYDDFVIRDDYPFYVKRILENEKIESVTFLFSEYNFNALPFYIKPFSYRLARYNLMSLQTDKWDVVTINNESYLFIAKNWMMDKRLKTIEYKIKNNNEQLVNRN